MKILYHSFIMPALLKDDSTIVGGAAVQWKSWIRGFLDNNYEFGLLTYKGANKYINKELDFDVIESYDRNYGISRIRVIYYQLPMLLKAIRNYKPDYIIQGGATANTGILMIIAKILKIPFVHRIANDPDVDDRIKVMVHRREIFLYKLGARFSDAIITQNSYQFNKLKEKYPKKKIFIVHNPFEISTKREDILPREGRNYIAWVGNFRYMKNMQVLYHIAKENFNIKIKIAGKQHRDADKETLDAIEKLRNLENVEFVGYLKRSEIIEFFLNAIALLNTSRFEGFSNTFLEAWSSGTPVISTKYVNPDNIISNHNLGFVANNYDELSNKILDTISLPFEEYNEMSMRCYDYVSEHHNPKKLAKKFVKGLIN